jgi:hypothetical protein
MSSRRCCALMCIPRTPNARLYLRRAVPHRMHKTEEDYPVFWRERPVGDVWFDPSPEELAGKLAPWRWSIDTTNGGTDNSGWWTKGRARTREEAMDALGNALGRLSATKECDAGMKPLQGKRHRNRSPDGRSPHPPNSPRKAYVKSYCKV